MSDSTRKSESRLSSFIDARNYRAVLEKAGMLGSEEEAEEEEFDDVSLGLQPQEEGEDGGGV